MTDLNVIRRSTKATLDEIVERERKFAEQTGFDIRDEDEWQQLKDIVARIESKLKVPAE